MSKLLSANIARLRKSKAFWFIAAALFLWGVIAYTLFCINVKNMGTEGAGWNVYFFNATLCIGPALAVFCSFFIGIEYSDGTLRNKLAVGHTRPRIYLANLLTCSLAGFLFLIAFWTGAVLIGLPGVGVEIITRLNQPILGILCSFMVTIAYAAIFCFIAMLDSNKARSATIGLLLSIFLLAGGFSTYNGLAQPEFTYRMVMNEAGEFEMEDHIPNSRYLAGAKRKIYECLDMFLPSCQALRPPLSDTTYSPAMPLCAVGLILVLTTGGVCIFKKKDIK